MADTLKYAGMLVMGVENANAALEQIKVQLPALIITDLMMPGINGFEFLSRLHTNPETADIPVIVISGVVQDDAIRLPNVVRVIGKGQVEVNDLQGYVRQLVSRMVEP
jgi:CheY-like chemotaxis protein